MNLTYDLPSAAAEHAVHTHLVVHSLVKPVHAASVTALALATLTPQFHCMDLLMLEMPHPMWQAATSLALYMHCSHLVTCNFQLTASRSQTSYTGHKQQSSAVCIVIQSHCKLKYRRQQHIRVTT
jgi:hypothetical protein